MADADTATIPRTHFGEPRLPRRLLAVCCAVLPLAACASAPPRIGARVRLTAPVVPAADARVTLAFFVATDCPISNAYAPEITRIAADYAPRGVAVVTVYPDAETTDAAATAHADAHGLPGPIARDPGQRLARRLGIGTVPEAALVRADGTCVYRGRIDDTWADYHRRRPAPTVRDLRAALEAVLAGRPAAPAAGPTVGCPLPARPESR